MEIKKFTPDLELLDLAENFSKNYKKLSSGATYRDSNGVYQVNYEEKLIDDITRIESSTDARVNQYSGVIELSKSKLSHENYTSDYVFYIIIYCKILYDVKSNEEADLMAIKYYMTTNRPIKNLVMGILQCFKSSWEISNIKRYKKIDEFIKNNLDKNEQ